MFISIERRHGRERGQAILLFVGIFSVILVMAAIVIDFGLWWAERRSAQRVADLAAAAGAQDLPLDTQAAFQSACTWADENGLNNAEVSVEIFQRGVDGTALSCAGGPQPPSCGSGCDALRVRVTEGAPRLFTALPFFGLGDVDIGAMAAAGLTSGPGDVAGIGPDQAVLLIDAQSYMSVDCNRNPTTCAMGRTRTEASNFVQLFTATGAEVGYAPYTHCYEPDMPTFYACVPRSIVVEPTNDIDELEAAIAATEPINFGRANLCMPLLEAWQFFAQSQSGGKRTVIFLSNGDNRYNHSTFWDNIPYPPDPCRPWPFDETFPNAYHPCEPVPVPEERRLDLLTMQIADQLKSDGVEIYVIGLNVCSPNDTPQSPTYCAAIGNTDGDDISDQRLLKCVASSPEHYQSVSVDELPGSFIEIASEIVSRSLLQ